MGAELDAILYQRIKAVWLETDERWGDFADALLDIITFETNRSSWCAEIAQSQMNVRVLGVVKGYREPFEWCA